MSFLFGSSKPASSGNSAYPWVQQTYAPQAQTGVQANNLFASLLGAGGTPGAGASAYGTFKNASGYQNIFNEAMRGTTNSQAGRGILNSGATGRALQTNAGNLAQGSFGNYLQMLQALSGQGTQAGSLIAGAGQTSTGGSKTPGLLDFASQLVPFF